MNITLTTGEWISIAAAVGIWALFGLAAFVLLTSGKRRGEGDGMWLVRKIANEPVAFSALVATVSSGLVVFGLDLTQEETGAAVTIIVAVCTWLARSRVSPVGTGEAGE